MWTAHARFCHRFPAMAGNFDARRASIGQSRGWHATGEVNRDDEEDLCGSGCSGCGDGGPRQGPGDRSDRDPPGRAGSAGRHLRRHSRGRRRQGRREDAGEPGEGDGALDQAVPDAVPEGQRARPQHQGAAGDLDRHRRLPEGRERPRRRVDEARGARQGRRRRCRGGAGQGRGRRLRGLPQGPIARAEQRPRPCPGVSGRGQWR